MTKQKKIDILERVIAGFTAQGTRSENKDLGTCYYRSPSGQKCAIGLLIPDSAYDDRIDRDQMSLRQLPHSSNSIKYSEEQKALRDVLIASDLPVDEESLEFLIHVQQIHDASGNFNNMMIRYRQQLNELRIS